MEIKNVGPTILICIVLIIAYFIFGMSKSGDEFTLNGWFFIPARLFKRFICGMFLGHDWEIKNNECYCSFCLKKRRK